MLTGTGSRPAAIHAARSSATLRVTIRPISTTRPALSATGMNCPGPYSPPTRRTRASTPTRRRVAVSTWGW